MMNVTKMTELPEVISTYGPPRFGLTTVRMMDVILEVASLIDLNAPFLGERVGWNKWCTRIAREANENLGRPNPARDRYGSRGRTDEPIVTGSMARDIIRWLERAYETILYTAGESLHVHLEEVPRCPSCKMIMKLSWVMEVTARGPVYRLIWVCPRNGNKCKDTARKCWSSYPDFIYTDADGLKIFFRDWKIPNTYRSDPPTKWSLTRKETLTWRSKIVKKEKKSRKEPSWIHIRFTDDQIDYIRKTYSECGPYAFLLKYPRTRVSLYDIQRTASAIGVAKSSYLKHCNSLYKAIRRLNS